MTTRCKVCRDLNCVAVTHRFPITRCGNCDHITEEMSRAIDRRAFLCVRQSRDRARIARIESHSNDSFQLANERLKDVRKFAVAASACCPNCVPRRHALDAIHKEIAALEAEACATAERADRIQRRTISNMSIFDEKLEEASMELAGLQQVMNELIREDNFLFFAYGASFAGSYAEVVEVATEGNTPPTQENSEEDFAPVSHE
ncbi:unnamed protein product [Heligmosomoides polygyrus]|uniref:DM domain-containing protein n=1 Tax=Heligmosomoides polygyrus TaxID=6339 RepID=A0A183G7V5_HELPZ|nr:unnamed protein product [Heligmosomoides polygyrus]